IVSAKAPQAVVARETVQPVVGVCPFEPVVVIGACDLIDADQRVALGMAADAGAVPELHDHGTEGVRVADSVRSRITVEYLRVSRGDELIVAARAVDHAAAGSRLQRGGRYRI